MTRVAIWERVSRACEWFHVYDKNEDLSIAVLQHLGDQTTVIVVAKGKATMIGVS